jgi:DNA-binding MarR family transcriptional regulator
MTQDDTGNWDLLASHGLVLIWLARRPDSTVHEAAQVLGLTERRITRIIRDLVDAGFLTRRRVGRCNTYSLEPGVHFRHPVAADLKVECLLAVSRAP